MFRVITTTIDYSLAKVYRDFTDTFGFGPCGAFAALKRKQGCDEVAACIAHTPDGDEFIHYVIWNNGIVDLAKPPCDESLTYTDLEILEPDEMPELIGQEEIDWLEERL